MYNFKNIVFLHVYADSYCETVLVHFLFLLYLPLSLSPFYQSLSYFPGTKCLSLLLFSFLSTSVIFLAAISSSSSSLYPICQPLPLFPAAKSLPPPPPPPLSPPMSVYPFILCLLRVTERQGAVPLNQFTANNWNKTKPKNCIHHYFKPSPLNHKLPTAQGNLGPATKPLLAIALTSKDTYYSRNACDSSLIPTITSRDQI